MRNPIFVSREMVRAGRFGKYWENDLDDVFSEVAPYYDQANVVASLGLWHWFRSRFMSMVMTKPGQRVLDLCAGTNAVGIALLNREPTLQVFAFDRSVAMQSVGRQRAATRGLHIESAIGDAHHLPYPDNHFDVVTLQWASRHLRIDVVMDEVARVLKPGGSFHHCDMLKPARPLVARLYFAYLRRSLNFAAWLFASGPTALACRRYFVDTLDMFYSAEEFAQLLKEHGFVEIRCRQLLVGMIGLHSACKPPLDLPRG